MWLPFSVGEATLCDVSGAAWPVAERQGSNMMGVWLGAIAKALPGARLTSFEMRVVKTAMQIAPARRQTHLYVTSWQARDGHHAFTSALTALVVHASDVLSANAIVSAAAEAQAVAVDAVAFAVSLAGGGGSTDSLAGLVAAFDLARAHTVGHAPPPVWMLTAGALAARSTGNTGTSSQAGLLGLTRQARSEAPQSCLPIIDLDEHRRGATELAVVARLAGELGLAYSGSPEPELAFDGSSQRVPRLTEAAGSLGGPVKLHFDARGAVSGLRVVAQEEEAFAPTDHLVQLHVGAVGLNFRDVLNVLGVYPGDPGPPGGDCAAHIAAKGPGSSHLRVGDAVLGHGLAALASISKSDGRLLATITESLSFEQACTLPTTWMTVHMSLLAARPAAGHSVLLHAGAGGVGLAAAEYSHWLGARVTASVGRPYKHFYLHRMGLAGRTVSSRDGGAFALGASRLLGAARLRFTLNSLSADFIACSFALLSQSGCFGEIGKRAVWSFDQRATATGPCVQYDVVALDSAMAVSPSWMNSIASAFASALSSDKREMVSMWLS